MDLPLLPAPSSFGFRQPDLPTAGLRSQILIRGLLGPSLVGVDYHLTAPASWPWAAISHTRTHSNAHAGVDGKNSQMNTNPIATQAAVLTHSSTLRLQHDRCRHRMQCGGENRWFHCLSHTCLTLLVPLRHCIKSFCVATQRSDSTI